MKPRAALLVSIALLAAACGQGRGPDVAATIDDVAASAPLPAADQVPVEPVPEGDPRLALAAKMPGVRAQDLRVTPVSGLYELVHGGEVTYVSADGAYVLSGNLFKVTPDGEFPNLTENRRRELRLELLGAVPEKDMIVFGAARSPYTITVFTDVDCQWCQHMHTQIDGYNQLGIRVRYLAYPRTGPDTDSWYKLEAVWCAADRNKALTEAKLGRDVKSRSCDAPVAREFALGQQFKLSGTPGVVLPSGELVPGYLPPEDMLQAIRDSIVRGVAG